MSYGTKYLRGIVLGLFITIEGPNGVGKSTIIKLLQSELSQLGTVFLTKEPSETAFGAYVKSNEGTLKGKSYAHLIAADRCYHVENFVIPSMKKYGIVLCDRYIESSLVLQYFDGVDLDYIWNLNSTFPVPDLSITLTAAAEVLRERLSERENLSAFEVAMTRELEIDLYTQAESFLISKGYNVHRFSTNPPKKATQTATEILDVVNILIGGNI